MAQENREKYAYLDRLSTRRLEELLLADAEDTSGRDTSEVVFHILEVLQEREDGLAVEPPDVDRAWEEFQAIYNTPEGQGQALYPCKEDKQDHPEKVTPKHRKTRPALWRTLRVAAATVALLFILMIGVQASGLNVFGALAQWTNETFHFGTETHSDNYDLFLEELSKNRIPKELAPTWYPPEFIASEPVVEITDSTASVSISFSNANGNFFSITFDRHSTSESPDERTFEKDSSNVEVYTSNSKTFYILSNIDSVLAVWTDDFLTETIWGNLSIDNIKSIVDSIGGS